MLNGPPTVARVSWLQPQWGQLQGPQPSGCISESCNWQGPSKQ